MTDKTSPEKTPNDALGDLVVTKLKEKGYIAPEKVDEVAAKIKAGTASREDWKLWVDLAGFGKSKGKDDGKD